MVNGDDEIRLLFGLPVKFQGRELVQFTLKDIVKMGVNDYYNKVFPFLISLDFFNIDAKEGKTFDLFWILMNKKILGDKYLIQSLLESLSFFFGTENIKSNVESMEVIVYDEKVIKVEEIIDKKTVKVNKTIHINETVINRDNFDELVEKILLMTKTEKLKKEESLKDNPNLSDRAKKYFEEREKYKGNNKKDGDLVKSLYSMVNYLVHCQEFLDYKNVLDLTMYQATNSLNLYNKKDAFKINLSSHFAGAKVNKKDLEHWSR